MFIYREKRNVKTEQQKQREKRWSFIKLKN